MGKKLKEKAAEESILANCGREKNILFEDEGGGYGYGFRTHDQAPVV
jgi:hypothetical protein